MSLKAMKYTQIICSINGFVIDIETTGLDYRKHGIVEIAWLQVVEGSVSWRSRYSVELPIGKEITPFCEEMHKNLDRSSCVAFEQVAKELIDQVKTFRRATGIKPSVIGHNFAKFDAPFIRRACEEAGVDDALSDELFDYHWIDTCSIAQALHMCGKVKGTKLTHLAEQFNIDTTDAHTALGDCLMTYRVLTSLLWLLN